MTIALAAALAACGASERTLAQSAGAGFQTTTFASGLEHPWGVATLPDGRMLVTERPGRLRYVSREGQLSAPIQGAPRVYAEGQGGMLDVALDPGFAQNQRIYLSFAEPGPGGAGTAVARARLDGPALADIEIIFRQAPKVSGGIHFGGRLVFAKDGALFVTLGERGKFDPAQDLRTDLGKVVRIAADGATPQGNPFATQAGAKPEIWSYGHRNVQAAAIHPDTGRLWIGEMGPSGGDELNLPEAGRNYGWPLVSFGKHYDGRDIPDHATRPDFAAPIRHWTPVISPSGMLFYTGAAFPDWRGNLFIGSLTQQALVRLTLDGDRVTGEERYDMGRRIRDVEQGADGALYLLTDENEGEILRLSPP